MPTPSILAIDGLVKAIAHLATNSFVLFLYTYTLSRAHIYIGIGDELSTRRRAIT
jgi:hypothetical protein